MFEFKEQSVSNEFKEDDDTDDEDKNLSDDIDPDRLKAFNVS